MSMNVRVVTATPGHYRIAGPGGGRPCKIWVGGTGRRTARTVLLKYRERNINIKEHEDV